MQQLSKAVLVMIVLAIAGGPAELWAKVGDGMKG
jgi:hypothetical protein